MSQYDKALSIEGECFKYICTTFPSISYEKIKGSVFDGPYIRKLMRNPEIREKRA